jgi:hypothetical protein
MTVREAARAGSTGTAIPGIMAAIAAMPAEAMAVVVATGEAEVTAAEAAIEP